METTILPVTVQRNEFYCPDAKHGKSTEEYCRSVLAGQGTKESLLLVGGERRMSSFGVSCKKKSFSITISALMHFENDG